jgi:hypothetical protein
MYSMVFQLQTRLQVTPFSSLKQQLVLIRCRDLAVFDCMATQRRLPEAGICRLARLKLKPSTSVIRRPLRMYFSILAGLADQAFSRKLRCRAFVHAHKVLIKRT